MKDTKSEKLDCLYVSDRWASRLNGRPDPNPSPALIEKAKKIMNRSQEEHNNRVSKPKSASELFAEEIDALTIKGVSNNG